MSGVRVVSCEADRKAAKHLERFINFVWDKVCLEYPEKEQFEDLVIWGRLDQERMMNIVLRLADEAHPAHRGKGE